MTDTELVNAFLDATSDLSDPERAREAGVTHTTIARWKARRGEGGETVLHAGTRRKVASYLERVRPKDQEGAGMDGLRGDGSPDLWRHIDANEANPALSEVLKILKLQEIAAAIRAEAMNNAEWAARIRAEALRAAEAGTLQRSEAIKAEAESAAARIRHIPTATEPDGEPGDRPLTAEEKARYGAERPPQSERGRKAGRG